MAEDLTDLCNRLTARIGAKLPPRAGVTAETLVYAILGTVTLELGKRDGRVQRAERQRDAVSARARAADAALTRVRAELAKWDELGRWKEWSDVHEFVEAVREAIDPATAPPAPDQGTGETPDLCGDIEPGGRRHACTLLKGHLAHRDARRPGTVWQQLAVPEDLKVAVELVLLDHHGELEGEEVDANLAELATVYQQLTGWDALEEIAEGEKAFGLADLPSLATGGPVVTTPDHEAAHAALEERFKDAATWTETGEEE